MKKNILSFMLIFIFIITAFGGCTSNADTLSDDSKASKKTIEDYRYSNVGVNTGSYAATFINDVFPDADVREFNILTDMILALKQGKIDVCVLDESFFNCMKWEGFNFDRLEEPYEVSDYGIAFKKDANTLLRSQINDFIAEIKANGEYEKLQEKWFGDEEPAEFLDPDSLTGTNGTIKVATANEAKPFEYISNGKLVGYDIDFIVMFAEKYGYKLDIEEIMFTSILMGVQTGKYDIGIAGLTISEERAESVDFSDSYHQEEVIFMISEETEDGGIADFFASFSQSFEKTFVREDRWKLIVEGVFVTMLISAASVVGGTILGFALYMLGRSKYKSVSAATNVFTCIYSVIISGTPTLVVLMILFYIVFGKSDISGITVAIIGFIITFASFVVTQLAVAVDNVDRGQTEAAYALGYGRNRAFFRIVIPQAMKIFVPAYTGEIVGLIKTTSVVGYIAVNDLTKMGDIIRGNTYEAFFPLIAVALIYFILIWGITLLLGILRKNIDPKNRKKKVF